MELFVYFIQRFSSKAKTVQFQSTLDTQLKLSHQQSNEKRFAEKSNE